MTDIAGAVSILAYYAEKKSTHDSRDVFPNKLFMMDVQNVQADILSGISQYFRLYFNTARP